MKRSLLAAFALLVVSIGHASAQSFPAKPVRLINPYQAGGGVDLLARLIAGKLQERWGQPVVVESKPGAGGNVGADFVAKSPADGYTLLLSPSTLTTNPYFFAKMPFDVQKDLAPISLIASQEFYIVANNAFAPKTMAELIAYAKANPGKISYATPGIGTPQHLGAELLKSLTGTDIVHVPYKGQLPAITDVMSGQVHITWVTLNQALPLIQAGKIRGIAIAAKRRVGNLKDVPIVAETIPGYEVNTWFGLFAPAGTPNAIIQQLAEETQRIAQLPEVQEKLLPLGYEVMTSTPQELRAIIAADLAKWGKVVRTAGIKLDQ
jgi:tripartite-type tricarboxylate transporter receptor subunit TctC